MLLCAVCTPAYAATVPKAAELMGREMDQQIAQRFGQGSASGISLSFTTPMDVNNLEVSSPLARQMQEELANWFVQAGYDVREIRKGRNVLFKPKEGEMLLTRKERLLGSTKVNSKAVVSGTYTVTENSVRFTIRIVTTGGREVLAMSGATVPLNRELAPLARSSRKDGGSGLLPIEPTVVTLLP
jgi:hypothetical protein